jgi:hypothetical protein
MYMAELHFGLTHVAPLSFVSKTEHQRLSREIFFPLIEIYFVFKFAIQKFKDIQNYSFACCFVWV